MLDYDHYDSVDGDNVAHNQQRVDWNAVLAFSWGIYCCCNVVIDSYVDYLSELHDWKHLDDYAFDLGYRVCSRRCSMTCLIGSRKQQGSNTTGMKKNE